MQSHCNINRPLDNPLFAVCLYWRRVCGGVLSNLAATPVTAEPLRGDLASAETQFLLPPTHVSAGPAAAARRHGPGGRKHEPTSPLALRAASSELPGVAADEPVPWADFANVFKGKTLGCNNRSLSQLSQVSHCNAMHHSHRSPNIASLYWVKLSWHPVCLSPGWPRCWHRWSHVHLYHYRVLLLAVGQVSTRGMCLCL